MRSSKTEVDSSLTNYNYTMTLQATLAAAQSEEDVKDAYVKALGLKALSKGKGLTTRPVYAPE
jgi:hypothetical protein